MEFFWSKYGKILTRKNSVFGHFSRSALERSSFPPLENMYLLTFMEGVRTRKEKYAEWKLASRGFEDCKAKISHKIFPVAFLHN